MGTDSSGISKKAGDVLSRSAAQDLGAGLKGKKEKGHSKVVIATSNENLKMNLRPTGEARSAGSSGNSQKPVKEKTTEGRALNDITNLMGHIPNK